MNRYTLIRIGWLLVGAAVVAAVWWVCERLESYGGALFAGAVLTYAGHRTFEMIENYEQRREGRAGRHMAA